MIMELPEKFKMPYTEVKNGTLIIHQATRFEDLMYELTYATKKRECIYCGLKMKRKDCTLDHRYPRYTGGISITNNLFPCCQECNTDKGMLTHYEYLEVRKLSKRQRKERLKTLAIYTENTLKRKGFKLPRNWIEQCEIDKINYKDPVQILRGNTYQKIREFYKIYHKLPRPVIVDRNYKLLDGYNIILFSKDFEITEVPVIHLENVVVL